MRRFFASMKYGSQLYILAIIIMAIVVAWGYYRLVQISWIAAGVLIGLTIPISYALTKRTRPSFWSIVMNCSAALPYTWVLFVFEKGWLMKCGLMFLFLPVFILANKSLEFDIRRAMRRRSERGEQIMARVLAGEGESPPKFGLYLRPFVSTDRLPAQVAKSPTDMSSFENWPTHLDFETIFSRALDQELDIVALGSPEDIADGVARLQVEEVDWQKVVKKMAQKASLILILPLYREGTLWELRLLKAENYLHKTVFLLPEIQREQPGGIWVPSESDRPWGAGVRFFDSADHFFDFPAEWQRAREMLAPEGFKLPPYLRDGAFFTLDPQTGEIRHMAPLPLSLLNDRQCYVQSVLVAFGLLPATQKSNPDFLAALAQSTFPTRRNREYVLTLGFRTYLAVEDVQTASTILDRIYDINSDGDLMVHEMVANLPAMLSDPAHHEAVVSNFADYKVWLKTLQKVEGIDAKQVKAAQKALQTIYVKSKMSQTC